MKTYLNEEEFVTTFAKDCKQGIKSNGKFEAEINGATIVIMSMDNNTSSKVTIYTGGVNGADFTGSITALKKRLNVTYTKEYNRSSEAAKTANTKVAIKSDTELEATAKTAAERIKNAVTIIKQASQRYGLSRADMLDRPESVESLIFEALKKQRGKAQHAREAEARRKAEEAARKIAEEKAKLERQLKELQAKLAKMQ